MCGISGLANCGDREVLTRMTHVQAHRGPDDSGLWERKFPDGSCVGLGSDRLAILDLSASGHMPMCNEARTVWITYNGEIYNFAELRRELQDKGHRFASNTPAEVLRQPKAGFAAPVEYWLAHDLREMVDDLLSETNIRKRGLFQPKAVRRFVDEHRSGAEDWSMQIWQFLTLEQWMRVFLDAGAQRSAEEFGPVPQAATA